MIMLTRFPISSLDECLRLWMLIAECQTVRLDPRYAIFPPLLRLSRVLKFTNRNKRQREADNSLKWEYIVLELKKTCQIPYIYDVRLTEVLENTASHSGNLRSIRDFFFQSGWQIPSLNSPKRVVTWSTFKQFYFIIGGKIISVSCVYFVYFCWLLEGSPQVAPAFKSPDMLKRPFLRWTVYQFTVDQGKDRKALGYKDEDLKCSLILFVAHIAFHVLEI